MKGCEWTAATHHFFTRYPFLHMISASSPQVRIPGTARSSTAVARAEVRVPTTPQGRGPNYRRGPKRTRLVPSTYNGATLLLSGKVFAKRGGAMNNGFLVVWGTSPSAYNFSPDMTGYGVVPIAKDGSFSFVTALPTDAARPAHVHIAVEHDGAERLVTQLYFEERRGIPSSLVVSPTSIGPSTYSVTINLTTPYEVKSSRV